jgi:hypothetical protein
MRAQGLRENILDFGHIRTISNFRYNVWKKNAAETLVIVIQKNITPTVTNIIHPRTPEEFTNDCNAKQVNQVLWHKVVGKRFLVRADVVIVKKIESHAVPLSEICDVSQGIIVYKTREQSARNLYISDKPNGPEWKKLLDTKSSIGRYSISWGERYLKYGEWLWCSRNSKYFEQPKLLFVRLRNKSLSRKLVASYDDTALYNRDNFNNIIVKDNNYSIKYVLGLFNSNLLNYWYKAYFDNVNINPAQVRMLPLCPIDTSAPSDKSRHDKMVQLVDRMLELHKKLGGAKVADEKNMLERQIEAVDGQIDGLVYELYGLSDDEIGIVEGK